MHTIFILTVATPPSELFFFSLASGVLSLADEGLRLWR
jgi:hypothetical protein